MKVLLVYPFFAHYRLPVIKKLIETKKITFHFAFDPNDKTSIKKALITDHIENSHILCVKNYYFGPKSVFLYQKRLLKSLLHTKFDCIIFLGNTYHISTWIALVICKFKKTTTGQWTHGLLGKESYFLKKTRLFFYNLSDIVFLYGDKAKKEIYKYKPSLAAKSVVIYNSEDYSSIVKYKSLSVNERNEYFKKLVNVESDFYIVSIGRLTPDKKIHLLIEALHILKCDFNASFHCVIVGDGETNSELKRLTTNLELEKHITFTGALYGLEAASVLCNSSLCVVPGNIGLSAMHAMASGCPVVSHNNFDIQMPEHEAIIEGLTGSFFQENDANDLACKISFWISNKHLLAETTKNCEEVIRQKYNPEVQADLVTSSLLSLFKS